VWGRALLAVISLALAACATAGAPSPSPGGFQEVLEALARRGATVTQIVSGDPGCADPTLVANAIRFHIRLADGVDREVHLFGFRDAAALARAQASLNECMRSFMAGRPGESTGSVQVGPFRAFGAAWSKRLSALLADALREAIGGS
jgi:hypothetical protein